MSQIPNFKPLTRNDLKDYPKWLERILEPLISQIEVLTGALQNDLTFAENFRGVAWKGDIQHDSDIEIVVPFDNKPYGILILDPAGTKIDKWTVTRVDVDTIKVNIEWDGAPSDAVENVTIFVLES